MTDNTCTYCGQEGHRASHCPRNPANKPKPEKYNDRHTRFLDELQESGATNMFGASPFLQQTFPGLTRTEAMEIVAYWMRNK